MAQQSNEHLTITQLSTYRDKELAPNELALCDAHLQTCQLCQAALADIQLTTAMLRRLPQVEVPRSFVLPENLVLLPHTHEPARQPSPSASNRLPAWKSTLRLISTLAAIVGLLFILVGAFSGIHLAGSVTSTSDLSTLGQGKNSTPATSRTNPVSPSTQSAPHTPTATEEASPTATATPEPPQATNQSSPPTGGMQLLDINTSAGRLEIGLLLLLLGILGFIPTRRAKSRATP